MPTPRAPAAGVDVDVVTALDTAARRQVMGLASLAQERDGYPSLSDQALLSVGYAGGSRQEAATDSAPIADPPTIDATLADTRPRTTIFLLARRHRTPMLLGCAVLERPENFWNLELVVHPEHRYPDETGIDVDGALLDAALAEALARGDGIVQAWGRSTHDHRTDAAMAARGLRKTRELLQLRAPLTPGDAATPTVPVRPFRPGRDEPAWLEVNRRAFSNHPEQSAWSLADLVQREHEPWFDPKGFLLHEVDGRLAAFCWTKVHRTPVLGEIYVIGVDPDFQGRGLGRALTRAGLGHLATRGISTAMLYVEATNDPALVLYRSLGFAEHHRESLYTGELRGGPHAPS